MTDPTNRVQGPSPDRNSGDLLPTHSRVAGKAESVRSVENKTNTFRFHLFHQSTGQLCEDSLTLPIGVRYRVDSPHGSDFLFSGKPSPAQENSKPYQFFSADCHKTGRNAERIAKMFPFPELSCSRNGRLRHTGLQKFKYAIYISRSCCSNKVISRQQWNSSGPKVARFFLLVSAWRDSAESPDRAVLDPQPSS